MKYFMVTSCKYHLICYKQFLYAFWSEKQTEMTGYTFLIFILKFTISIQCCIGLLSAKFTHLFQGKIICCLFLYKCRTSYIVYAFTKNTKKLQESLFFSRESSDHSRDDYYRRQGTNLCRTLSNIRDLIINTLLKIRLISNLIGKNYTRYFKKYF